MVTTDTVVCLVFLTGAAVFVIAAVRKTVGFLMETPGYSNPEVFAEQLRQLAGALSARRGEDRGNAESVRKLVKSIRLEATLVSGSRPFYFGLAACIGSYARLAVDNSPLIKDETREDSGELIRGIAAQLTSTADSLESVSKILSIKSNLYKAVLDDLSSPAPDPEIDSTYLIDSLREQRVPVGWGWGGQDLARLERIRDCLEELCRQPSTLGHRGSNTDILLATLTLRNISAFLWKRASRRRYLPDFLRWNYRKQMGMFNKLLELWAKDRYSEVARKGFSFPEIILSEQEKEQVYPKLPPEYSSGVVSLRGVRWSG